MTLKRFAKATVIRLRITFDPESPFNRMAADVVKGVKATGRCYNGRPEKLIREALASGKLAP